MQQYVFAVRFSMNYAVWTGCHARGICADDVPDTAVELHFEVLPWNHGPPYREKTGQVGGLYDEQIQWAAFIGEHGLNDPLLAVDFLASDVVLYERMHDGCEWDVIFDGAFLLDETRYIRARPGEDNFGECGKVDPRHAVLILEKVEGASYEICDPG